MRVFISWSGNRSFKVARFLDSWISSVIQAIDPWISSEDIDKGSLWFSEITTRLATTQTGIVCLTKENLNKPWILFEAGALAKGLSSSRVFTFLIDLEPKDVTDPLAQFNHTLPDKGNMYRLMSSINKCLGERALKESKLKEVFGTYWPQFDKEFKKILDTTKTSKEEEKEERPKDDILNEILYSVRSLDKRLRTIENAEQNLVLDDPHTIHLKRLSGIPLEDLDLTVRTYNCLKAAKINTIGELVRFDVHELLKFRNFTKKSLVELEEVLGLYGLRFGMDIG